jgi:hypothetical protein
VQPRLADAASQLEILSMMKLEDAGYWSRLAAVLRSCSCGPCHVLTKSLAGRSQAGEMWCWRVPEVEALVGGCSKARPGSCLGTQRAGHVDDCLAAPLVSTDVSEAAGLARARKHSVWAAGWRRPGSSAQLRHSVRSALAGWSRWTCPRCLLQRSVPRFRRREGG